MHIIDLDAQPLVRAISLPQPTNDCDWHPREDWVAVGCMDGKIRVVSAETGEIRSTLSGHLAEVMGVIFSPSGDLLASRSWDGTARFWELATGRQLLQMDGDFTAMAFRSDEERLFVLTRYQEMRLLEMLGRRECLSFLNSGQELTWPMATCFSPDGRWLATADSTGVRLWDSGTGHQIARVTTDPTSRLLFSKLGPSLLTLGHGTLTRWPTGEDMQTGRVRTGPPAPLTPVINYGVRAIAQTSDGRFVAVALDNKNVLRFAIETPEQALVLGQHDRVSDVSISPDGRYVATGSWDGAGVKVWDCRTCGLVKDLIAIGRANVSFSPDGRWLLTSTDYEYRLWNVGAWTSALSFAQPYPDLAGTSGFSLDGRLLALNNTRFAIQLVDPSTGDRVALFESPDRTNCDVACFSPDGTRLAIGCGNMVRIWDLSEIHRELALLHLDRVPASTSLLTKPGFQHKPPNQTLKKLSTTEGDQFQKLQPVTANP